MGDNKCAAQMDICLTHQPTFILLVLVKDKTLINTTNINAQVVVEVIAAFQSNNRKCINCGLNPLVSRAIPCITMVGT